MNATKPKPASWRKPRPLTQQDWDFSDCPKSELPACYRYEYCRESQIREAVLLFRLNSSAWQELADAYKQNLESQKSGVEQMTPAEEVVWNTEITRTFRNFDFFGCVPGFPDTPWLDLDKTCAPPTPPIPVAWQRIWNPHWESGSSQLWARKTLCGTSGALTA